MWWKFGPSVVPFLLASSLQQGRQDVDRTVPQPQTPLQPFEQQKLSYPSLQEIRRDMDEMYSDLVDRPGPRHKNVTSTLRFSFVAPPINGTSTWRQAMQNSGDDHYHHSSSDKPIAIYLPGLDGSGVSAFNFQFDDLAKTFELWRLVVSTDDRSDFRTVLSSVVNFVQEIVEDSPNREVILIGESFGGMLASAVALTLQKRAEKKTSVHNPVQGLVLVNPATAFYDTNWDTIVPVLASLQYLDDNNGNQTAASSTTPTPYSVAGGLALSYLMPDRDQFQRIVNVLLDTLDLSVPPNATVINDMVGLLDILEQRLPAATLQHRVNQWLTVGTELVNQRLGQLQTPTLIVAGDQDKTMPSQQEMKRLTRVLPRSESLVVRGRGHFVLDENVNLTEAIIYSKLDPLHWNKHEKKRKRYDPIKDWTLPSKQEIDRAIESQVKRFRDVHSPVFFSTDQKGKRWMGLTKLPRRLPEKDGPILFVANHQFFGADLGLIIAELLQERNMVARGLAHPIVFNSTKPPELLGRTPGLAQRPDSNDMTDNFQKFGAVPVSPRNYFRLMQTGQNALLFPGGVKDVFETDLSYPLAWPEKPDFVRTAARFNATIVPISAVGMADSVRVVVNRADIPNLPFVGERVRGFVESVPKARFDDDRAGDYDFIPPVVRPHMPARNYFVFGKPFLTEQLDPKDKDACAELYSQVIQETRRGLDDLLRARKTDPFSDTPRRLAYEQVTRKKAPTFSVDQLNK